jgi:hypothetical protein
VEVQQPPQKTPEEVVPASQNLEQHQKPELFPGPPEPLLGWRVLLREPLQWSAHSLAEGQPERSNHRSSAPAPARLARPSCIHQQRELRKELRLQRSGT